MFVSRYNIDYELVGSFTCESAINSDCPLPLCEFDLSGFGRYLKIVIDSYHGIGAGWQYLNIEHGYEMNCPDSAKKTVLYSDAPYRLVPL